MTYSPRTVFAETEIDLLAVLTTAQVLQAGTPAPGMGWQYHGSWSDAGGAPMRGVCALIWWNAPPQDDVEQVAVDAVLSALRAANALYEGPPVIYPMGNMAPQRPTDHEWIAIKRDARRMSCGVQVGGNWFHSDPPSRDLYNQGASQIALGGNPAPQPWKTMQGTFVLMTKDLLLQVLQALSAMDGSHHVTGEIARAQLKAGVLTSVHDIQWPSGFRELYVAP